MTTPRLLLLLLTAASSKAQQLCLDSSPPPAGCTCYPGTTNAPDCNLLACADPFQNISARIPFDPTLAGAAGSLGCNQQCTSGFTGSSCNICQNVDACQSGISSSGAGLKVGSGLSANKDVICNKEPIAYTANFGECSINNPTVQTMLPGKLIASIQRFPDPQMTSLPNSAVAGLSAGTTTVQILYAANTSTPIQEQFFCKARNCTQKIAGDLYSTNCGALQCKCRSGSSLCGSGSIDLTNIINSISGEVTFECPFDKSSTTSTPVTSCNIQMGILKNIFGPKGFTLSNCQFGECVQKSVAASKRDEILDISHSSLSAGVLAGLVLFGLMFAGLLGLIIYGFYRQHLARNRRETSRPPNSAAARVEWRNLKYWLPLKSGVGSVLRMRRPVHPVPPEYSKSQPDATTTSFTISNPTAVQILSGLSGSVEAGTMMAILGPSGAGKSTFLDVLAGQAKTGQVTGNISFSLPGGSQEPVIIGFVEQSDILPATSTVREALMFSARLKLPEYLSNEELANAVSEIVELLGLSNVIDSRIGDDETRGLSGGERRRLSIGIELIARPSVLILDEPTSGLDSVSAMRVVKVLKALSNGTEDGRRTTVICSIHQPSSQIYHSFDYVCLLASGGRQIYCGPTSQVMDQLESYGLICPAGFNPADFLLEVASEPPVGFRDEYTELTSIKSETMKEHSSALPLLSVDQNRASRSRKPVATMITQLQVIGLREWRCLHRDPSLFWFQNAVAIIIGTFVGGIFFQVNISISGFQNRVGSLFFTGAILAFSSLSALTNFYHVRLLFMRERAAGFYSPSAWLICRAFFDVVPLRIIPTFTMGAIIYWMVGLTNDATHFLKFLLVLMEYCLVQTMLNFFLAATTRNLGAAVFLGSLVNLLQLAFAGFFVNLTSITPVLRWIQYIMPIKFSLEAMAINEVSGGLMIEDTIAGARVKISALLIMNMLFGFNPDAFWRDVIILLGFLLFFTMALVIMVIRKLKQVN